VFFLVTIARKLFAKRRARCLDIACGVLYVTISACASVYELKLYNSAVLRSAVRLRSAFLSILDYINSTSRQNRIKYSEHSRVA